MTLATANGITIKYDTFGSPSARPLLLIMGLGTQMTRWPEAFCDQLAGRGHYVIRFDNRDVGLSEKFHEAGVPDMAAMFAQLLAGETPAAPYTLTDMARDAFGLLDHLEIERAHVAGASMGGMIAQTMAIADGTRLRSLISIMSATGNPEMPESTPEARAALLSPAGQDLNGVLERAVQIARSIGSPDYPAPEEEIRRRAQADFERSFYPVGVARQMAAVAASGNRRPALAAVQVPTLVLHGEADPLVPFACGVDTHEAIPGSRLHAFPGMGHDLPEPLWPQIVDLISEHTETHH